MPDRSQKVAKISQLYAKAWGKYDDIRMPWVGKYRVSPEVAAITDVSSIIAQINPERVWLSIINDGTNIAYLGLGNVATANSELRLNPGGSVVVLDRNMPWADRIEAVCGAGLTTSLLMCEVSQAIIDENGRGD